LARCRRSSSRDAGLVVGVLDRFEADRRVGGIAVHVQRAVADRKDVRQAGAGLCIDEHAVAARGPGREQRLDGGQDADADNGHVGRDHFAARQAHAGDAGLALDRRDLRAEPNLDAMGAMLGLEEARQRFAGDAGEDAVQRLDHGHLLAELGEDRRRLQPDIAAADHRDPGNAVQLGHHPIDIGAGAHGMDAGKVMAVTGQAARLAAGRPDQLTISDRLAVRDDGMRDGIDRGDGAPRE
ncbi:conserved hypothetical protein, partial [Ricinus communis]